jgi:hypothetical protein
MKKRLKNNHPVRLLRDNKPAKGAGGDDQSICPVFTTLRDALI